jgi:hypothetical protein
LPRHAQVNVTTITFDGGRFCWQFGVLSANHEKQSSPYNLLKRHMTADLAALVYGSAGSSSDGSASDLTTSSAAVLAVSRQLAQQRVGVVGVDCDATSPVGAGGAWSKGAQHDTCVGQDLLEYLLRSEREWTDRGGFHRIYPRPSRRNIVGGDELERLLGYIGQLYPEYGSATNAAAAAKDRAGARKCSSVSFSVLRQDHSRKTIICQDRLGTHDVRMN